MATSWKAIPSTARISPRRLRLQHGQAWAGGLHHEESTGRRMTDPTLIAFERVKSSQRDSARRRRLDAIRSEAEPIPF